MLQHSLWMPALDRYRELGPLLLRLFVASILIYGTQDNILSTERMLEFRDFLDGHGFPYPLASAHLSVYAQFTCGILFILGLLTRWAAIIMIVNFLVALAMVHVGLSFSTNIAPLAMLFGSIFFLFYGAGPISLDARLQPRSTNAGTEADLAAPDGTTAPTPHHEQRERIT
jgi:putative oxidoreductase